MAFILFKNHRIHILFLYENNSDRRILGHILYYVSIIDLSNILQGGPTELNFVN